MGSKSDYFYVRSNKQETTPRALERDEIIALKERLHVDDGGMFIARISARLAVHDDRGINAQTAMRIQGGMTRQQQRKMAIYHGEVSAMMFAGLNEAKDRPQAEWPTTVPAPEKVAEIVRELDLQEQALEQTVELVGRIAIESTEGRNG